MFPLTSTKVFLITILILVILIPTGSFILAQRVTIQKPSKSQAPAPTPKEVPAKTPVEELKELSAENAGSVKQTASPSPSAQVSFGPTLDFKISIEGRPKDKHQAKIFLGIASGQPQNNPAYLLSFLVSIPSSGDFKGLSIAGLTQGSTYTAYLKGPAQIASASAFTVRPTTTNLGLFNLLTGDLNEDNNINSADYSIAKAALGTTSSSQNWNQTIDFNLDNTVNNFDLGIITKNLGKIGASGIWVSPPPPPATQSGTLNPPNTGLPDGSQGLPDGSQGYWLYIPGI